MHPLRCCNGTYYRQDDTWHYPWGEPVPGSTDLTVSDLMALDDAIQCVDEIGAFRELTAGERRWLTGEGGADEDVHLRRRAGYRPNLGDLIVGMIAPELHALTMMTVTDVAESAGVSKATIDSYRYRGYLPEPQVVRGRTPLWARPIIRHWLSERPGPGWRSDVYVGESGVPSPSAPVESDRVAPAAPSTSTSAPR